MISLPENVAKIIQKLTENGYEAYAVGGCVRDSIIHRVPGDWDITTSAMPMQVKALFKRTIDTGIKHGTVTIMMDKTGYEVTTYRIDGEYEDSRHPKNVIFTSSLSEDLRRRDFTINAMAYNDSEGIIDLFSGREDIKNKIIRCVGDARERFCEDALRMLRAVRFSAQLGYSIEEKTAAAIRELSPSIANISRERIHTELTKILLSDNPDYIFVAKDLGITGVVLSAVDEIIDVRECSALLRAVKKDTIFRYAALFYSVGGDGTRRMLKELKLDNYTIENVSRLVSLHKMDITADVCEVRKQASDIGICMYEWLLEFEKDFYRVTGDKDSYEAILMQTDIFRGILERKECLCLKDLAVTGKDLIDEGMKPGKEMGAVLEAMLEHVLAHPSDNDREILLSKFVKK